MIAPAYIAALADWLACATRGASEPAARAAREAGSGLIERVAAAGAAGHVLDFDDTFEPGLAHLSAPVAPASLVLAAHLGRTIEDAVDAYVAGFEAMGALAAASHPALYDAGLHPTSVCGWVGAAMAAATLLELGEEERESAAALALTASGGMRAAFGSDGKAVQVGLAAAGGVHAALTAAGGARMDLGAHLGPTGFQGVFGGRLPEAAEESAIERNWIKAWPCCLQTHGAIEAALELGAPPPGGASVVVAVHPLSRQAAPFDVPATGLEAKFSIPYLTAFALLRGEPGVHDFREVDAEAAALPVEIRTDPGFLSSEARIETPGGEPLARTEAARGSPGRPLSEVQLTAKLRSLAGSRLDGLLEDPARPAADALSAAGI